MSSTASAFFSCACACLYSAKLYLRNNGWRNARVVLALVYLEKLWFICPRNPGDWLSVAFLLRDPFMERLGRSCANACGTASCPAWLDASAAW